MNIHFENHEDYEKRKQKVIDALEESQLSEYIFNGEPLYLIGRGHDFIFSFFYEYITKSGIEARKYYDFWIISNERYNFSEGEFVKIEIPEIKENIEEQFSSLQFPIVKKVFPKLLANDITPTEPKIKK